MGGSNGYGAQSEAEGIPCPIHPPVWQRLHKSAVICSSKLALASFHQSPILYGVATGSINSKYLRWSYNDLNLAINTLVGNLQRLGAKSGQSVATFLYNDAEFIMAFWIAHKLDCPFVSLNPRSLINVEKASHMLRVTEVSIVLIQNIELAARFDALFRDSELKRTKIIISKIVSNLS